MPRVEAEENCTAPPAEARRARRGWIKLLVGLALLGVALAAGRSFGHHIPALEQWIAGQGVWGYLAFVGVVVVEGV